MKIDKTKLLDIGWDMWAGEGPPNKHVVMTEDDFAEYVEDQVLEAFQYFLDNTGSLLIQYEKPGDVELLVFFDDPFQKKYSLNTVLKEQIFHPDAISNESRKGLIQLFEGYIVQLKESLK